jgi:hypothetical protein
MMLSDIVSNEGKESDPATWEKCLERYIENLFSEGDAVALRRLYQKLDQMRAAVKQKRDNLTAECSTTLIERDLHRNTTVEIYIPARCSHIMQVGDTVCNYPFKAYMEPTSCTNAMDVSDIVDHKRLS